MTLRNLLQRLLIRRAPGGERQDLHSRNVGDNLLEWPERAEEAVRLAGEHLPPHGARIADYGCGRQTLRRIIPVDWDYTPYDYCSRSADTVICDFNAGELPPGRHDAIFCMGVLEYLDHPLELLAHAIGNASFVVFSYNGFTTAERRNLQGWKNDLAWEEFDSLFVRLQAPVLAKKHLGNNEWIYVVKGNYETCASDRSR
ncbi:class I SAM-dependent methyltransferase [Geomonas subterranea]|uniref:class I SAM-dependent methyltransferase n=1 Tax=Geomonas subterranea TaxID=2847989 RepID=UPI001CD29FFC|nr:class I SAM-dependent methyltransferase [Geomonas fuzhouensis]